MSPKNTTETQRADLEEIRLLDRIAAGDEIAFEDLHRRYVGVVYNTVYRVLNDTQDTEDVSQEVFRQIWQKAHL